jgi:transposase
LIDESGFMLQPVVRRTWAARGLTPELVACARHDRWSVITALTVSPERKHIGLYFQGFRHNICGNDCELFVWALHQQLRRPLLVVWDGLSAHKTAANSLASPDAKIVFERFPPYSPQLNPVEFVWAHTKHGRLANVCPMDWLELGVHVATTLHETRRHQRLLRSFFTSAGLALCG